MADSAQVFTLQLTPRSDEAIKPAELIQVSGHHNLTLYARRAITIMWHHAHMQGVKEGKRYTIELDELKTDGHKGYEGVVEAIEALMRTLLVVRLPSGKTRRVQFLGGNDMDSPDRPAGVLTYSFDPMLIEILSQSTIWGKIALPILMAFTSKYAISLYENVSQFVNLTYKSSQDFTLDEFRNMLGVPEDKYPAFGEFNKHVLKPAVAEINALAAFNLTVLPVKEGKKVVRVKIGWWKKDEDELREAFA
ncbi:replication initiation protein, partial [Methylobacterium oryzae]|uniref:replication initiation protein n=1 Tax=Methylobacterium oryzae TaxID=334852 RepID=UPI002F2DBAEE